VAYGRVPGVADQDGIGTQLVGVSGHEALQGSGGFFGPLHDQFQVDRHLVAKGAQRGQVHHDVAFAIGGAAAVPAPVHLGQLERRGPPVGLAQRRLDVVMGVEQHGRRAWVRARPAPEHGVAPIGHVRQPGVGKAGTGKGVQYPLRRAGAFFRRELAGVSH
jgi:hypothetical protein